MAISKAYKTFIHDGGGSLVSSVTTATFDSTGFTHLVCYAKHEGAVSALTIADNKGSTSPTAYTKQDNRAHDSWGQFHSMKIGTPGTGHTATLNLGAPGGKFVTFLVWVVNASSTGLITKDAESVAQSPSDGTAIDAGNLVTSGASVVSFMGVSEYVGGVTYTPGSGWTEDQDGTGGGTPNFTYGQSRGAETTTPIDPVCTGSAAQDWAACSISFKESSASSNESDVGSKRNRPGRGPISKGKFKILERLDIPSGAIATQSFSYTAVGGIQFGGVSDILTFLRTFSDVASARNRPGRGPLSVGKFFIAERLDAFSNPAAIQQLSVTASGGIQFGGIGSLLRLRLALASGGIQFGGTSIFAKGKTAIASGGILLAGTSGLLRNRLAVPAGGLNFAGTSGYSTVGGNQSFSYTATGGITFAGTSAELRKAVFISSGGIVFSGSSDYRSIVFGSQTGRFYRRGFFSLAKRHR